MTRRSVIASVSGVKAAQQQPDAPKDIASDPGQTDVAERDSGDANDPSTTGPVDGDGNVDPNAAHDTNLTVASANPTNADVANAQESADGVDIPVGDSVDTDDGDVPEVDELASGDHDLDEHDEEVVLSEEEIAAAAAELEAEKHVPEPHIDGDDLSTDNPNPQDHGEAHEDEVEAAEGINDLATAPVSKTIVGNDGQLEDASDELNDQSNADVLAPAHNGSGHRNTFINRKGDITVMDDDTAERFYTDPKFYEYVYDGGTGTNMHVGFLRWSNDHGEAVGGVVGDEYELDK